MIPKEHIELLKNQQTLFNAISTLSIQQLQALLDYERNSKKRFSFMVRIQGRINKLMVQQSLEDLMK